jgi:very-short-patch-repair endonuclease
MSLENARELRKNATDCERLLWVHLRAHRLQGFKFKRQQPIGAYIVDFVCFETRCIVEADGGQHSEQIEYDARRDDWLKSQGFSVLRFWNNDILTNTEGVLETILSACLAYMASPSPQPLPRQGGGANAPDLLPGQTGTPVAPVPARDTVVAIEPTQHHQNSPFTLRETVDATESSQLCSPLHSWERGGGRGDDGL